MIDEPKIDSDKENNLPRKRNRLSLDERAALPLHNDNPSLEFLRLNRQEICRREIDAAVRLFLIDEDPISAHLLASAAMEIMIALSNGKPGVGMNDLKAFMKTAGVENTLSEEVFHALTHPYNFLKHGSSDFEIENDFSVDFIVMTIYSAIHSFKLLFGEQSAEMMVFYSSAQAWRLHWWEGTPGFEEKLAVAERLPVFNASRAKFCEFGRSMLEQAWEREAQNAGAQAQR